MGPEFSWVYKLNGPFIPIRSTRSERRLRIEEIFNDEKKALLEIPHQSDRRPFLVSSEGLVGVSYDPLINADLAADLLATTAPEAKIIITVRRQDDWSASLYRQLVFEEDRFRRFLDFEELFQVGGPTAIATVSALQWDVLVGTFKNKFGPKNVCVLAFEELCEQPNIYIERLLNFLEVDRAPEINMTEHVNVRPVESLYYRGRWSQRVKQLAMGIKNPERFRYELSGLYRDFQTVDNNNGAAYQKPSQEISNSIRDILFSSNQRLSEVSDFDFGVYNYH